MVTKRIGGRVFTFQEIGEGFPSIDQFYVTRTGRIEKRRKSDGDLIAPQILLERVDED